MIAVRGAGSRIAQALRPLIPLGEEWQAVPRGGNILNAERYLFCQGLLVSARLRERTSGEIAASFRANATDIMQACDAIFAANSVARVCVIGSESAYGWSYDSVYAAAKAALHRYVETKKLRTVDQQLVCISPGIIEDCGMTTRRLDYDNLSRRRAVHPKGRFLTAGEVARLVHHVLYVDEGYLSGVVIRMNGGAECRAA